jgi:trehalose 6-phosphate phosphatase
MLSGPGVLLAFDFDGTLAPIEEHHRRAEITSSVRQRLCVLARRYACVVISGRPHRDLCRRLRDVPLAALAGSHGAEIVGFRPKATSARSAVRVWATRLRRKLQHLRGVDLESKPYGLAVHYRRAEDKESAHLAVLAAATALRGVRRLRGKDVIELLPAGAPNKGEALTLLRQHLRPRATLYVGDDATDEDAFRSAGPGRLLGVRVGPASATFARYRLDQQDEIELLLDELLRLEPPPKGSGRPSPHSPC